MRQLSFVDTAFLLQDTPARSNHLGMIGIYDPSTAPAGSPTFADFMAKIEASLPVAPTMRRKLVHVPLGLDRPYWVEDPAFDLEFHVREIAVPAPGDWCQFRTLVARLYARPLDLRRPPWELTIIRGVDQVPGLPTGCFGVVLKVHHAAIDGMAGLELWNALHTLGPDVSPDPVPDEWQPEPIPPAASLLGLAATHAVTKPLSSLWLLARNASPLVRQAIDAARAGAPRWRVPRTRFNAALSPHRTFDEARCPLADLKAVKAVVPGASINDVCLSVIGGALRRYLASVGELPEESLMTIVPVSTRTPEQAGATGNQISMMRVNLGTDLADPIERLAMIQAETARKKAAQSGVAVPVLLDVAQTLPGALIGGAARSLSSFVERGPVFANTIVTNVPASPVPLYLLGCELVRSTGMTPLAVGVGLFHAVSSYAGTFSFMVTADRDALADPTPYTEALEASIAEHVEAATALASAA